MTDWFDRSRFESLRGERGLAWGSPLTLLDRTPSTNDVALQAVQSNAAQPAKGTGSTFVAHVQTEGRGRRGNTWQAGAGESLLCSVLVRLSGEAERMMGLSLVVGLAVRDVVQSRLEDRPDNRTLAQIKWPNDVLVDGKKIAGILVETRTRPTGDVAAVLGIGLNLHADSFPPDLPGATSLKLLGVKEERRGLEVVTADVLAALEKKVDAFLRQDFSLFLSELFAADFLHGRLIRVGKIEGRGSGFDTAGRLLIAGADGRVIPVISGTVELLRENEREGVL